jgi:hypothetical protein
VHELERIARPCRPQQLDRAEADPAAAVTRDAGRLVDHEKLPVLGEDRRLDPRRLAGRRRARIALLGDPDRRNPDSVPGIEPVIGLRALAVHADLPRPKQSIDEAFRDPFQPSCQEVVDALAVAVFGNLDGLHARSGARVAKTRRSLCLH